ncbi:MAG: methionine--tRNA ligase [Spirochaetales bacterium]|nr:methionine--tRNA ligase [Spirochaetales bacterium]
MEKRLITSALPYVNNIPHLGNLIQVLSADVFARYCKARGFNTLYICGTDEYGTATETKALEEGITPKELCDRYYKIHSDIYRWFNIDFSDFGRTSRPEHTEITQYIFKKLDENGYIQEQADEQTYCETCGRFLADRYVRGTCPYCGYEDARGDQCENCGKLLDPTELINPRCSVCGNTPIRKETKHLYIDLPAILPKLKKWMDKASAEGFWAHNAIQMTNAWIRDGLKKRCITRDLKWGIPVPKPGFENKVFYVWFDAPIGYISMTMHIKKDWESWWKNPEEVKLYQFIGKDNIPFHTVIFPSSLIGTGEKWTMLHHMSSTEYLNYESGKFSKSKGIGVFGTDAKETEIPADVWRFYIFYNRPERSDAVFTWKDFQEKVNGELIGNLSNLVNRTLTFAVRYFDGDVSRGEKDADFWKNAAKLEKGIENAFEKVELRDAFRRIFALSSLGNKKFQDAEPWKKVKENPDAVKGLLWNLLYLIRDLAILIRPYMPETSNKISDMLGIKASSWEKLLELSGITKVEKPSLLFKKLEDKDVEDYRDRFSGSQKERAENTLSYFRNHVELRAAKIIEIEKHPKADKLYIEKVDFGNEVRQIVSGLVPYYKEEELLNRTVIVVANLKSVKLRGVESNGMLLAADDKENVEVLFADSVEPGSRVILEGDSVNDYKDSPDLIDIDSFFSVPINIADHNAKIENKRLVCSDIPLTTGKVERGAVR